MSWFDQPRTLALSGRALPQWLDEPLLVVSRVTGKEELGKLYEYDVELNTVEDAHLPVQQAQALVDLDELAGKEVTLSIAIEGNGTWVQGATRASMLNIGADVRKITGVIAEAHAIGADERRAFYRFKLRPRLWISTLNRDSRTYQNRDIKQISTEILNRLSIPFEFRLSGPFLGKRGYPARDYQRQWWESDYAFLDRLWQEWGITYFYDDATLVLCDSPGSFKQHGPAYQTVRYLDRGGQRIDEEHIHAFNVTRRITTGKVSLVDYDYTQSVVKLTAQRTQDNAEEYAWGDYAQPLATPLGVSGRPNDAMFEAEHLAQVKVEAHRAQSRLASGSGNLRGLMTGYKFRLEGYPLTPGDGEYLVVSTALEIVNNDTVTHRGALERRYQCKTHFTAVPADTFYRTPQTAAKPRAYGEMAVVVGFDDQDKILTDPYGRVKVHFVWDRVRPLNDTASCWLQVASPWQGPGYGALWTPRVGQMVQIGYFDSDPDRPFVMAAHSTENHQLPWELPRNSVLSGWRSRDLNGQSANSVLTDDTPGQLQVQVASDHAQSRLVLGSNTRIDGHKGRSEARGVGFELATQAHGVLRANAGLLMTTEARAGATSPVKDMGETVARLTQARGQHEELGRLAQQHLAQTAELSQADAAQAIKTQNEALKGGAKAHDNPSPEMTRPDVVLASSAGIATTAAESTHQASSEDHAITAGRDMSVSLGRSLFASVRGAISMFAYQLGLKLIAAKGKVEIQAQSDQMALAALKDVTISSTDGRVVITASKEVWIGAGGSYVQINGSGIINGSPGAILEKGASWDVPGPSLKFARTPTFATHPIQFDCGETGTFDTSPTLSSTFLVPAPPEASASTANPEPASTKIDPPRSAEAGKVGTCTWNMSGVVETVSPKAGCADYLAVDKAGNPYPSQQSQLHAHYASFGGTFDLAYDQASKSITATVRVLVEPKQVRQTQPDGTTKIVSYDHDLDAYGAPGRTVEDRPAAAVSAFLRSEKAKIERDLNQNGYFLTKADCEKGAGCGCKIPVSFCVELLTADPNKIAHATVNLHPASVRANSGNWSEVVNYVDPQTKVEKPWPTVHHVLSHEVGHLFSFPDEYYWGGGAVHRTYVKADSTIDLPLAKNNPDKNVWQGTTADSLMGGGVYDSVAMTPPYYLVHICDWFKSKNGITWKAVKSKEP